MKHFILPALFIFIIACSKDEAPEPAKQITREDFYGTWERETPTINGKDIYFHTLLFTDDTLGIGRRYIDIPATSFEYYPLYYYGTDSGIYIRFMDTLKNPSKVEIDGGTLYFGDSRLLYKRIH